MTSTVAAKNGDEGISHRPSGIDVMAAFQSLRKRPKLLTYRVIWKSAFRRARNGKMDGANVDVSFVDDVMEDVADNRNWIWLGLMP